MSEILWQGKLPPYKLNAIPSGTSAIAPAAAPQEFLEEGVALKSSPSPGKLKDMSDESVGHGPGEIQEGNLQNAMEVRHCFLVLQSVR